MIDTVEPLAAGSSDVFLDGTLVAGLVRNVHGTGPVDTWVLELLDEWPTTKRPTPFVNQRYIFRSRIAALEWLGIWPQADDFEEPSG